MIIHAAVVYNILSSAFGTTQISLRAWVDGRLHAEVTEKHHLDLVLVNFRLIFLALMASVSNSGRGFYCSAHLISFFYLVCSG